MKNTSVVRTSSFPFDPDAGSLLDNIDDNDVPLLLNVDSNTVNINNYNQENEEQPLSNTKVDPVKTSSELSLSPVPVTILSGFLGSGKTTLIQHILRSPGHGRRIAVIENEFSGTSTDGEGMNIETLIARNGTEEGDSNKLTDLIELPNGCICCTVKDSLVETLELLLKKQSDLDYILIEASGMANPGPIASVFWVDEALECRLRLDGIVTCVDAYNIGMQLQETSSGDGGDEAAQQIAFADRIIVNKVDLLSKDKNTDHDRGASFGKASSHQLSLVEVLDQIQSINATAQIKTTTFSMIPDLEWILDAKCFDVNRAKEVETAFAYAENLSGKKCTDVSCANCQSKDLFLNGVFNIESGSPIPCKTWKENKDEFPRQHSHTSSVGTVALVQHGSVNLRKMHVWLASILWPNQDEADTVLQGRLDQREEMNAPTPLKLVEQQRQSRSINIFRIKGILSVQHEVDKNGVVISQDFDDVVEAVDFTGLDQRRYIVQAVNDMWEINPASASLQWDADGFGEEGVSELLKEERVCKLVVIGRHIDREALLHGFRSCFTKIENNL